MYLVQRWAEPGFPGPRTETEHFFSPEPNLNEPSKYFPNTKETRTKSRIFSDSEYVIVTDEMLLIKICFVETKFEYLTFHSI